MLKRIGVNTHLGTKGSLREKANQEDIQTAKENRCADTYFV